MFLVSAVHAGYWWQQQKRLVETVSPSKDDSFPLHRNSLLSFFTLLYTGVIDPTLTYPKSS